MPQFNYVAVDKKGSRTKGQVEAPSEAEVRVLLRAQQLRPVRIFKSGVTQIDLAKVVGGSGASIADVLMFTRQMSILINAGIPLIQGIEIIEGQIREGSMKKTLMSMRERVGSGSFLWESMRAYRTTFPDIYVSMVRAGEASGSLDTILKRLIRYLEDGEKLRKMVIGALIYPIAIVSVGIIVIIVMLYYVIPQFETLLKDSGQALPAPTQFVVDASHFVQNYILFILGGIVGSILAFRSYAGTKEGRVVIDHFSLKLPMFGELLRKVAIARFTRTMQTLLSSGINLLDALDICKEAIGNKTIEAALGKMKSEVEQGKTLSSVIARNPLFPNMVAQMVTVGETTGNLDKMFEKIADFYEEDIQNFVGGLTKLIEPFILVVLGGIVGGLMIAMYLPIFTMAGGVQ